MYLRCEKCKLKQDVQQVNIPDDNPSLDGMQGYFDCLDCDTTNIVSFDTPVVYSSYPRMKEDLYGKTKRIGIVRRI